MITKQDIEDAQASWGNAVVDVGAAPAPAEAHTRAVRLVETHYLVEDGSLLFCPTKAAVRPFRRTLEDATQASGMLRLTLKRPWSDGTVALELTPLELVERLAAMIPPPRKNQILYHGVLAPRSAWRKQVVPGPRPRSQSERRQRSAVVLTKDPRPVDGHKANRPRWIPWYELLKRTFEVDGLAWSPATPALCGQRMALRAVVMPPATLSVLEGLTAASRGPPDLTPPSR